MITRDIINILKASRACGIKVRVSKSFAGEDYTSIVYNKAGDTIPFNPTRKIGDAMQLMMKVGGTITIDNKTKECVCFLQSDQHKDINSVEIRACWGANNKNKERVICKAIVELICRGVSNE